jgi:hypothetical protein
MVPKKTRPNEGIRLSLRNALITATLLGGVIALTTWPVLTVALRRDDAWRGVLPLATIAALVGFVWRGGREVILHVSLRTVLAARGDLPRDLTNFLDHCTTDLRFLRRVGGAYMFIHRSLQEYFADVHGGTSPPL